MNVHLLKKKGPRRKLIYSGIVLAILGGLFLAADAILSSPQYSAKEPIMERIIGSKQYVEGKFRNASPWETKLGDMLSTLGEYIFSDNQRRPKRPLPVKKADLMGLQGIPQDGVGSIWLGHSSILLRLNGYQILLDPVLETHVSIFGPKRYNGEVPVDPSDFPDLDAVIISHNHYDHLNKATILALAGRTKLFLCPLGVGAQLRKWGIGAEKIVELDWWQTYAVDENLTLVATPAQHFSGRGIRDRDRTLWASWVIIGPRHRVFFSGDSGYFDGFKKIGDQYGPFDLTFMECGAYHPRWHHIHMFPEETVQAHLDLRGQYMHPIHWGTFNLSLHAWYDPMVRVKAEAEKQGVRLATPLVGALYVPGGASDAWWRTAMDDM